MFFLIFLTYRDIVQVREHACQFFLSNNGVNYSLEARNTIGYAKRNAAKMVQLAISFKSSVLFFVFRDSYLVISTLKVDSAKNLKFSNFWNKLLNVWKRVSIYREVNLFIV